MKKYKVILITFALMLCGCSNKTASTCDSCIKINYLELQAYLLDDEKDDFIFIITQEGCSYCLSYNYTLNNYVKKHAEQSIYYLNYTEFYDQHYTSERYLILAGYMKTYYDNNQLDFSSYLDEFGNPTILTPTTITFKDGEVVYGQLGNLTSKQFEEYVKKSLELMND